MRKGQLFCTRCEIPCGFSDQPAIWVFKLEALCDSEYREEMRSEMIRRERESREQLANVEIFITNRYSVDNSLEDPGQVL